MIAVAALAIADLHWRDFEDLIDLIFAQTGWQRVLRVGGMQKDIDLELEHPATEERAFVQVKLRAGQAVLDDYLRRFEKRPWDRRFFVTHSPEGALAAAGRSNVHIWASDTLAAAVVRSGLYDWLIKKAA